MSTEKNKKKSYPIINFKGKGSLILTNELLTQIFYLHSNVGNTEWSGVLLYDVVSGSPAKPEDFVLKARHIHLMNIGSSVYTEYSFDEEIIDLFDAVPEAMNMKIGQIHTHHTMSTGFSSTDTDELMENLDKHNYYLSLIVNMSGNYTAKVAFLTNKKTKSTLSYKSDSGENLTFETEENEEGMGIIEMRILMDYENKFFYDKYKKIIAEKEEEKRREKEKEKEKNVVYTNYGYGDDFYRKNLQIFDSQKSDKRFPKPLSMSDREVEKLSSCIVAVDVTLNEKNSAYTLLYSIAGKNDAKSDELALFYPKFLSDNLHRIITKFFGESLSTSERKIVMKEVIASLRRYDKIKKLKPVIDTIIPVLIEYSIDGQKSISNTSEPINLDSEIDNFM